MEKKFQSNRMQFCDILYHIAQRFKFTTKLGVCFINGFIIFLHGEQNLLNTELLRMEFKAS
jgi:hypothetical protein